MGCGCKKSSTSSTTTNQVSNSNVKLVESNSFLNPQTNNDSLTKEQERQVDLIVQKINEMNSDNNTNQ